MIDHQWFYYNMPPLHPLSNSLSKQDAIERSRARTNTFQPIFYPNCISEWSKLDPEVRLSPSVAVLKTKLLSLTRPLPKFVLGTNDPMGLFYFSANQIFTNSNIILGIQ